jgi:hypothetical protein
LGFSLGKSDIEVISLCYTIGKPLGFRRSGLLRVVVEAA